MGRREGVAADAVRHGRLFGRTYQAFLDYRDRTGSLRELQRERLSALLGRVLLTVPVLRAQAVEVGLTMADDPFETLARLPVVTKQQIRDDYRGHFAEDIDPSDCASVVTSGTTGVPLKIVHNAEHFVHVNALALRRALDYGLPLDRKMLRPFKSESDDWFEYTLPSAGFLRFAEFGFVSDPDMIARRCREFAPDAVFTHPSRALALRDLVPGLRPRIVQTFGEQLTDAGRVAIEEHFQAPVRDCYGTNEAGTIAAQCPEFGSYHIEGERLWVEVVDAAGRPLPDGVEGDIVVTNLLNTVMPFIRYNTGDVGALSSQRCPCGREQKVLRLIAGRQHGAITLPDGSQTDVLRLVKLIERFPVERLQVVQATTAELTVLVVPAAGCTDEDLRRAADAATAALHHRLPVRLRSAGADEFTESRAGKHLNFVNLLDNRWGKGGADVHRGLDQDDRRDRLGRRAVGRELTAEVGRRAAAPPQPKARGSAVSWSQDRKNRSSGLTECSCATAMNLSVVTVECRCFSPHCRNTAKNASSPMRTRRACRVRAPRW